MLSPSADPLEKMYTKMKVLLTVAIAIVCIEARIYAARDVVLDQTQLGKPSTGVAVMG